MFGAEDPLDERAVEQMLVGVSTRNYARSLEPAPEDLTVRGTSRSAVSRRFVAAGRFRRITGARDGMTALVRALKDHDDPTAGVAGRKQAA